MYIHVEYTQIHVLPTHRVSALCMLEQTAIISLYSIGFHDGDGVCLLCGTRFVRFAAMLRIHRLRNVHNVIAIMASLIRFFSLLTAALAQTSPGAQRLWLF